MSEAVITEAGPGKDSAPLGKRAQKPGKAPTSNDIRAHLLRRAKAYAELTKLSLGAVSQRCSGKMSLAK
jgi:hypothetical protein